MKSSIKDVLINSLVSLSDEKTIYVLKGFNYWIDEISAKLGSSYVGFVPEANRVNGMSLPDLNEKLQLGKSLFMNYENIIWLSNNSLAGLPVVYGYSLVCVENDFFDTFYPDVNNREEVFAKGVLFESEIDNKIQEYYGDIEIRGDFAYIAYNDTSLNNLSILPVSELINSKDVLYFDVDKIIIPEEYDKVGLSEIILGFINCSAKTVSILTDSRNKLETVRLIGLFESVGVSIEYREYEISKSHIDSIKLDKYRSILKRKNPNYDFYKVNIYKDPYENADITEVNQVQIIDDIVNNCSLAQEGELFRDIFVTAPTGAGKSVMFQVPAIYLAEELNLLTIVVSPLIGLMNDQVENIKTMTGLAATINSDYTPMDKEDTLERVKSGDVSILYLSPESLLSNTDITNLIGDRRIGLVVVDEAHIVATWGKSFRPDYWYLGDFIHKLRSDKRSQHRFPIATFTATATFGGNDNMYQEIIESLNMTPIKYIGNVKRDDIHFDIRHRTKERAYQEEKLDCASLCINELLNNTNEKSLVYTPYTRHIGDLYQKIDHPELVGKYYGGMSASDKNETLKGIKNGTKKLVLATKAFGMGIDIDDIKNVYHFAPTGNIADYIQEIGRAARRKDMTGNAITDFYKEDFRYVNQLYGMSSIKNYQVVAVLRKIYELYGKYKKRNFLVAPDEFSYIFADQKPDEIDAKLKTTLLIIKKDFESNSSLNYIPLIFKPRSMFTKGFFTIHDSFIDTLNSLQLMQYFEKVNLPRVIKSLERGSVITTKQAGDTYRLDFKALWESKYKDMSFGMFKRQFFDNKLQGFSFKVGEMLLPRTIIEVDGGSVRIGDILNYLLVFLDSLQVVFDDFRQDGKYFGVEKLSSAILEKTTIKKKSIADMLSTSVIEMLKRVDTKSLSNTYGFASYNSVTNKYVIRNNSYERNIQMLKRSARSMLSNVDDTRTVRYCQNRVDSHEIIIAQMIEILEIAEGKISSGSSPEFFIRVNSPYAIEKVINNGNYKSRTVGLVAERHFESAKLMEYFFRVLKSDSDRWNFIEQYFLGLLDIKEIEEAISVNK